ncbi:MAG: hypothetical protein JWN45_676 [Acidobacteriaceae bacterium]|nr:hypothetical protein [Acidobacteriaceae bacterium]
MPSSVQHTRQVAAKCGIGHLDPEGWVITSYIFPFVAYCRDYGLGRHATEVRSGHNRIVVCEQIKERLLWTVRYQLTNELGTGLSCAED